MTARPEVTGRRTGALLVVLAAALWGTTGTAGAVAPAQASALEIGAARVVLGGLLLGGVAALGGSLAGSIRRPRARLLVPGAIAVAAYQVFFFAGVERAGVAVGTVVAIGSAPAFTGALAALTRVAPLSVRWVVATPVAVAGCVVLILNGGGPAGGAATARGIGILFALGAGLSYAAYAVISSALIRAGAGSLTVMGALFGGAAVLLLPVLLLTRPAWVGTAHGLAVVAYLGVVATAVAYVLYGRGLRSVPVSDAATLSLAEPMVAALLGLVLLGEPLGVTTAAGMTLIAVSLTVITLTPRRRPPAPG